VDILASFFNLLYFIRARQEGEDKLWWIPFKNGLFVVNSFHKVLVCHGGILFPWKSIWQTKIPSSVAFYAWLAALGKILTINNLKKRHVIVQEG
jgi:hypothetical protein